MKLYIHRGDGFCLGSKVMAFANNLEEALAIIRGELDNKGLLQEKLNIKEIPMKVGIIYSDNGDY